MNFLKSELVWLILLSGLSLMISIKADDSEEDDPPIVNLPKFGTVVGYYKKSYRGRKYAAYEGIPYVQQPHEKLRFKNPVPASYWTHVHDGTFIATKKSDVCAQYADVPPDKNGQPDLNGLIEGSEDCLYLNIYVPITGNNIPKAVIFFIHGGSFQYASGNMFGDKYLADREVIFVTFNYRLGILGFLSTEDEVLPGNLGMKDQSLALRWVHDNIGSFGGDQNKIILVGFSAGSSSIQYHYLSPMSRGLFHSSIAMSGTAFSPWAYDKHSAKKARKLGAIFNCPTKCSRAMINCLRKVPVHILVNATAQFQYWQYNPEAPWAPVIEKVGKEPFLSKSPKEIFEARESYDVPAVYGAVTQEGCDPAAEYAPHDNLLKELNDNWESIVPSLFELKDNLSDELIKDLASESYQEYFGNKSISKETVPQLIKMLTDQRYFIDFENGIRLQAKASTKPVYFYLYGFRGLQSYSDHLSHTTNNYGVCHTDDMNLVVENPDIDPTMTKEEWEMSNLLMNLWETVAITSLPHNGLGNVSWYEVDADNPELKYMYINDPSHLEMRSESNFGNKKFWKKYFFTV